MTEPAPGAGPGLRALGGTLLLVAVAGQLSAEEENIPFQRPEAWAMAYVASALLPSPTAAIPDPRPGAVGVGGDLVYLRRLSTREEQVGFDGTAPESMDRTPVLGDLRAQAGLPGGVDAAVGWVPPVDVRGIRADVLTLACARQWFRDDRFRLGARLFGSIGRISGDITSDQSAADAPGGSPGNPLDTDGESHDIFNWRVVGVDLLATEYLDDSGTALFGGVEASLMHLTFHVRSEEAGIVDRTVLTTQGTPWGVTVGASGTIFHDGQLGGSVIYSPLGIDRPNARHAIDPFVTARMSLTVWLQ